MTVKDMITLLMDYPEDAMLYLDLDGESWEIEHDDWSYDAGTNEAILYGPKE